MPQSDKFSSDRLRVGAVSYLNTKPLVYGLTKLAPDIDLSYDLPSRLAEELASGLLDVALIPSIEFLQNPAYSIVSDACIGCRGPVLSVKLLSRLPMSEIRTLALDEGSRTSVGLSRILLKRRYGIEPKLLPLPIGADVSDTSADAILLIGDRAIHQPRERFTEIWDLGDQWCRWAELPFVFAMWTARPGVELGGLEQTLCEARDLGVANIEAIARDHAASVGLPVEAAWTYLRDNLHFYFGPREQRGLQLYARHAAELGMAPTNLDLTFDDCKTS